MKIHKCICGTELRSERDYILCKFQSIEVSSGEEHTKERCMIIRGNHRRIDDVLNDNTKEPKSHPLRRSRNV